MLHRILKKHFFPLLLFFLFANPIMAQKGSGSENSTSAVVESFYGIQTGLLGIWGHREIRIDDEFALRAEIGLESHLWIGFDEETIFAMRPSLTLEPRWYYNLEKRTEKSKRTAHNSGNFIAFRTKYFPDIFAISNYDNAEFGNDFSAELNWGIRRAIGKHFNFETAFGLGYFYSSGNNIESDGEESQISPSIYLRFGYTF